MSDENVVPASPDHYKPVIEHFEGLPAGTTVDTNDARYKQGAAGAHRAGLTQKQFSAMLAQEARRALAARAPANTETTAAKPAAEPARAAPAGKIPGYDKMSFAEKLAAGGHV